MARPPIIISNGGVASELVKGLQPVPGKTQTAEEIILENVAELNRRCTDPNHPHFDNPPLARSLRGGRNKPGKNQEKIYWRLLEENEHRREVGLDAR